MRKDLMAKGMILGVIGLFLGAGVAPSISSGNPSFGNMIYVDEELDQYLLDLPTDAQSTSGPTYPTNCGPELNPSIITDQTIIEDVPIYEWYRGCGPTAAGMVIGYWDMHGFDDLVGGSASDQTTFVNSMISSSENYYDYCLPIDKYPNLLPDKSEPPKGDEHNDNCVADFMKTSQSYHKNYYGWSWFSDVDDSISSYISFKNSEYKPITTSYKYSGSLGGKYCTEIDEGHPVVLLVDTDGNGNTDHFITAIGYDNNMNYACYNTWDTNIHWFDFSAIRSGNTWGIYGATFCSFSYYPFSPSNPYPADDSINVDINITLQWECKDSDEDNLYHIYLGKTSYLDEDNLLVSNLTEKYYNIDTLENNTHYYWKVVAEDEDDITTESDIWNFYTLDTEPPTINITNPQVGYLYISGNQKRETLLGGTGIIGEILIQFSATDNLAIDKIEFYIDNQLKYSDGDGFYYWNWDEKAFGKYNLTAIAYDLAGNTNSYEIDVWKLF